MPWFYRQRTGRRSETTARRDRLLLIQMQIKTLPLYCYIVIEIRRARPASASTLTVCLWVLQRARNVTDQTAALETVEHMNHRRSGSFEFFTFTFATVAQRQQTERRLSFHCLCLPQTMTIWVLVELFCVHTRLRFCSRSFLSNWIRTKVCVLRHGAKVIFLFGDSYLPALIESRQQRPIKGLFAPPIGSAVLC